MQDNFKNACKATIKAIIVAFFFIIIVFLIVQIIIGDQINTVFSIVNTISIQETKDEIAPIELNNNKIKNYPEYGQQYARLIIDSINLDLPVYFGDSLTVLKKGVGHSSGSYFPGEGGSIVYMAHNAANMFRNFSKLEIGDIVTVETDYGTFNYEIYNMKIINETDLHELPIQREEEKLMLYTCYPFQNFGYTTKRYVVYTDLVD